MDATRGRPTWLHIGVRPTLIGPICLHVGVAVGGGRVHDVGNSGTAVTRPCSVSFVPALSLKLVARRHVDYGRTRSMICMPA
jgi:hypothetical protein